MPHIGEGDVRFGEYSLNLERNQLSTVAGKYIALRPRSLAVLRLLASRSGEIVTKDELISSIWPDVIVTEDSLTQCVADIRRTIGDRQHRILRTVPRRGYTLLGAPQPGRLPHGNNTFSGKSTLPPTKYAKSGDYYIAYQITGDGPIDIVFVQGYITHLEIEWENPWPAQFYSRLGSFCRLIRFDKRGTGLSDHVSSLPSLEERMDDVRAVMDAAGSRRAVLWGSSEGAQ